MDVYTNLGDKVTGLLFIDDEEGVRRSITRALKQEPYTIYTAENGKAGIKVVEQFLSAITIAISDYKMPGMDGLETLSRIVTINPEVVRILLTGYATMDTAIRATNEGIDGFLTKPFDNLSLRKKIREILIGKRLRQFVSDQIYQEIKNDPTIMEPRRQKATILFTDIRGFTQMSHKVPPEETAAFLNHHYFTPLGEIAYRYNGTVDKHIGDSMMVIYGSPISYEDDILRAIDTAIEMQQASLSFSQELHDRNGFRLNVGIGICTGEVVTGVFGSLRKKEYTAFGTPVNIASRLEKLAKKHEILVSESTYKEVSDRFLAQRVTSPVIIKGLAEPVGVYRILRRV
ncbi:MAG: response regulator [Deltaproteobacteria bacterium]|nr:response regulator [Deltaproteobacteria bacterium]